MGCFSCFRSHKKRAVHPEDQMLLRFTSSNSSSSSSSAAARKSKRKPNSGGKCKSAPMKINANNEARSFTFLELAAATRNFKESNMIGEGGFGRVYKGRIETGQEIAAKRLNSDGQQGNQEFIVEVLMLNLFHHPNLVNLIGYCAEGNHRLLVYQYMRMGSLEDLLFGPSVFRPLNWDTRMKIALGAAKGLEYLHCVANPPVIYRDLKSANILLDDDFNPKLSDFGLAKLGPIGDKTHVSTRVMGTYGYCAPDYAMSGKLTVKSDIFSFGVVLLELITGRRAYDLTREEGQQSLVAWTRPYFRDRRRLMEIVDPNLEGRFPVRTARHLIALTSMLLKEDPSMRPPISEIVTGLEYLVKEGQNNRNWAGDDDF